MVSIIALASTLTLVAANCFNLEPCGDFNAFILNNMDASSDVQGKLAVGGSANFVSGFSVGDQLKGVTCASTSLFVRGSLAWPSGRNYFGSIEAGVNNASPLVLEPGCSVKSYSGSISFEDKFTQLSATSLQLSQLPSSMINYTIVDELMTIQFGQPTTTGIYVVPVPNGLFADAVSSFSVSLPAGSFILFNIGEKDAVMQNMDQSALSKYNVLFNFYAANSLKMYGIEVEGSILAPMANVNGTGQLDGTLIAKSFCGPMQINLRPLPTTCVPFTTTKTTSVITPTVVPTVHPGYGVIPTVTTTSIPPIVTPGYGSIISTTVTVTPTPTPTTPVQNYGKGDSNSAADMKTGISFFLGIIGLAAL